MRRQQPPKRKSEKASATTPTSTKAATGMKTLLKSALVEGGYAELSSREQHSDNPPKFGGLPLTGFVRLTTIIGDKKKGIPGVIPVGRSTWLEGVRSGRFAPAYKLGGCTLWRAEDIRDLMKRIERGESF